MKIIAKIQNGYTEKFGIPRQSGIVNNVSRIVFEKEYRVREAFALLDQFSHVWIIWKFSKAERDTWSPTVRPPKLGGNKRVGVFATRSPFRPNPIGLSCVKLLKIDYEAADGPVLLVEGADLMNGTPIYDVKPYVPYADSHPDATDGISVPPEEKTFEVIFLSNLINQATEKQTDDIVSILKQGPHPAYKKEERAYKMEYDGMHVEFSVSNDTITVISITKI